MSVEFFFAAAATCHLALAVAGVRRVKYECVFLCGGGSEFRIFAIRSRPRV